MSGQCSCFLYANKSLDYISCPYVIMNISNEFYMVYIYGLGAISLFWLAAASSAYTISQLMLIGLIYIFIMLLFSKVFCYKLAFLPLLQCYNST